MTKVYVSLLADHHSEVSVRVFSTAEVAVTYAKQQAEHWADRYDTEVELDEATMATGHWLYHAYFSGEGDCISVQEVELQDA